MSQNNLGYKFLLSVNSIDSIKPRQGGEFKNDEGDTVEYGHAVKFKTRNIELVPDEAFGEKEAESTLEVEIACDSLGETVSLNNHLKALKKANKPFSLDTGIPRSKDGAYGCKAILKGSAFINANKL